MIKFVNNNILFSVIFLILFFMNKSFHSHMSFNSDIIEYESTRERLQIDWVKNISEQDIDFRSWSSDQNMRTNDESS